MNSQPVLEAASIASRLSVSTKDHESSQSPTHQSANSRSENARCTQEKDGTLHTQTEIGWAQVFMSVERLSRGGKVSLTPVRLCEYRISIGALLRY